MGTIATMVLTPEIVGLASGWRVPAAGGIASGRQMAAASSRRGRGVVRVGLAVQRGEDVANGLPTKDKFPAATSSDRCRARRRGRASPARQLRGAWHEEWDAPDSPPPSPLPMPLQPLLVSEAWQRIDAAAGRRTKARCASKSPLSAQVVGFFRAVRPAAEITRQIVADCEQRSAELGGML